MSDDNGMALIKELPDVRSMMKTMLADLDLEGTYPTLEDILNISRETTMRELSKIRGVPEEAQRLVGINLTGGTVNALEIGAEAFKLPTPSVWLEAYEQSKKQKVA